MSAYEDIQRAALAAARMAWPNLPTEWVAWDEAPAEQADIFVTLLLVSTQKEDPEPVEVLVPEGDRFRRELYQRSLLNVDVRIESVLGCAPQRGSSDEHRHFLDVATVMQMAWRTDYVADILRGPKGCGPVVVEVRDIINRSADRGGVTLPMASFEVQFRALVGHVTDPTRVGRIDQIVFTGTVDGHVGEPVTVGPVP